MGPDCKICDRLLDVVCQLKETVKECMDKNRALEQKYYKIKNHLETNKLDYETRIGTIESKYRNVKTRLNISERRYISMESHLALIESEYIF